MRMPKVRAGSRVSATMSKAYGSAVDRMPTPVRAAGPSARRGREGPPGSRPNSLRQWTARSDEQHGGSFGSEDAGVRVVRIARGLSADNSWRACPAQRSIETMT